MKDGTKAWITFADRDLEAAKDLLENEYVANVVLFHCQQCIEKCLKAIFEEHEIQVPRIHSVVRLFGIIKGFVGSSCLLEPRTSNLHRPKAMPEAGGETTKHKFS